jgi:hypothetical protein
MFRSGCPAARRASVPQNWDPVVYRERAKAWREKAATLPEGDPQRAVCVEIADGYEKLAILIEQRKRDRSGHSSRALGLW